jgi:hypothetical protein
MQGKELRRGDIIPVYYYPGYKGTVHLDVNTSLHENYKNLAMG